MSDPSSPLLPERRRHLPLEERKHVVVVVLGDLGRSPRMQYHALSLLREGHLVTLVGYAGEGLIPDLADGRNWVDGKEEEKSEAGGGGEENKESGGADGGAPSSSRLNVLRLSPPSPPRSLRRGPLIVLYLFLRLVGLVYSLVRALWFDVPRGHTAVPVDCVLVQNPPSAPLLLIAWLYCASQSKIRRRPRPCLVIDWHNLGYTMFDLPDAHPIRLLARRYERAMAPLADGHLCVTSAMRTWLENNFGIIPREVRGGGNVAVLHDRPPSFFRPTGVLERHELMARLRGDWREKSPGLCREMGVDGDGDECTRTLFTERATDGSIGLRRDRPALVISSTSWTPDEDFGVLLDACVKLDETARKQNEGEYNDGKDENEGIGKGGSDQRSRPFPHVLVTVTGKGPQKSMYEERISRLRLRYVHIVTLWLESSDYPLLLGCADLGVSLHASTSGLDLPMKVYDMFGCLVPVCALDFACLGELVRDGENGRVFRSGAELAAQMKDLLGMIGQDEDLKERGELAKLREGVRGMTRWDENWRDNARGVILRACPGGAGDSDIRS